MIYVGSSGSERGEHLPRTHKFIAAVSVLEGVCRHLELPHVVRQGCKVVYSPTYPPLLSTGFDFLVVFFKSSVRKLFRIFRNFLQYLQILEDVLVLPNQLVQVF